MSANIKLNNIIASAIKGGVSKLLNTALSWTFSNKGYSDDGLKSLDKVPLTDEPTRLVDSYCADFNGTSSIITFSSLLDSDESFSVSVSIDITELTTTQHVVWSQQTSTGGTGAGAGLRVRNDGSANFYIYNGAGDVIIISAPASTLTREHTVLCEYNKATTTGTIYVDGVSKGSDTVSGFSAAGAQSFYLGRLSYTATWYYTGKMWDLSVVFNSSNLVEAPLQGSTYDVSGNDNHGTPTDITYDRQDYYHYNIKYGCDIYLDDATSTDYIYVPYVDGSPVVTSISGYTKQSSNPAGYWHNGSETKFIVGATTYDTGDEAWNVDALVQAADVDHILHSSTTAYGIPIAYSDLVAEQGNYLYFNVQEDYEHKDLILFSSPYPEGMQAVAVHKYVKNGDNLTVDINGEYIFDLNNYPIWSDE